MIKVHISGYKNGELVIHSSSNKATDNVRRIRPTCGQRSRSTFPFVINDSSVQVNCEKCLGH